MAAVTLETSDGGHVVNGVIPPFLTPPDVIQWGYRTFQLHQPEGERNEATVYRECFAVALVITEDL